jgi:hypothetical protein
MGAAHRGTPPEGVVLAAERCCGVILSQGHALRLGVDIFGRLLDE